MLWLQRASEPCWAGASLKLFWVGCEGRGWLVVHLWALGGLVVLEAEEKGHTRLRWHSQQNYQGTGPGAHAHPHPEPGNNLFDSVGRPRGNNVHVPEKGMFSRGWGLYVRQWDEELPSTYRASVQARCGEMGHWQVGARGHDCCTNAVWCTKRGMTSSRACCCACMQADGSAALWEPGVCVRKVSVFMSRTGNATDYAFMELVYDVTACRMML